MADVPTVTFVSAQPTTQAASAGFIQQVRMTLQKAQEITQAVSEAETVADEAAKYCEAIKAQHNIVPKKFVIGAQPVAPVPPLAASLTREIQTSVVWTQTMLEMCSMSESPGEIPKGSKLSFVKRVPGSDALPEAA